MFDLRPTAGHAGHGPHPAALRDGHEHIRWMPPECLSNRARTLLWTCRRCKPTYYLHTGGGRVQISRVDGGERVVTAPLLYRDGRELWKRILQGDAH